MGTQPPSRSIKRITGVTLLAIGSAVMVAYAGFFAWQFEGTLNNPLGAGSGLMMASLHALHAVAFDPSVFFTIGTRLLVLFSALAMTLIGIALLLKRAPGGNAPGSHAVPALPKGDQ